MQHKQVQSNCQQILYCKEQKRTSFQSLSRVISALYCYRVLQFALHQVPGYCYLHSHTSWIKYKSIHIPLLYSKYDDYRIKSIIWLFLTDTIYQPVISLFGIEGGGGGNGVWFHLQQYFSYMVAVSFIDGGTWSTRKKNRWPVAKSF